MAGTPPLTPTVSFKELRAESEKAREGKTPFVYECEDGTVITFTDPNLIHWIDLADLGEDPVQFINLCLSAQDGKKFAGEDIDSSMMSVIMDAFVAHYGLGSRGKGRGLRR